VEERNPSIGFWCNASNTLRVHLTNLVGETGGAAKAPPTRQIALAAVLTALTVALSPLYIPLGTTKCFPAQHMMNAVAGVLLGPWYAAAMALATGTIRNMFGLGTLYAFPGGIPGALVVGLIHRYLRRADVVALSEPIGTVAIGATLSALVLAPALGQSLTLYFFWAAFAASSVPGCVLGYLIIKTVRRLGFDQFFHE
jgi:energy coupling factor transporter S component ThiW